VAAPIRGAAEILTISPPTEAAAVDALKHKNREDDEDKD
jgi:hypothetical protein